MKKNKNDRAIKHLNSDYDPIGADLLINIVGLTVTSISAYLSAIPLLEKRIKESILLPILRGIRDQVDLLANATEDFLHLLENAEMYNPELKFMKNPCSIKDTLLKLKLKDYRRWYEINDKLTRIRVAINEIHKKIEQINLQTGESTGFLAYDYDLIKETDNVIAHLFELPIFEFIGRLRKILEKISSRTHEMLRHYQ